MYKTEKPYISIIIPTYNSAETLSRTIEASLAQDYPRDKLDIVVVDDGSKDDTKKIVEKFPIKYMYQERKGPASARNNGWRSSRAEGMCFIDADCVPYRNWISMLAQHYDKDNIGAVAGSYAVDKDPQYLLDKFVHYEIKYRHSKMGEYVNSFGTYNVLIKRSVLEGLSGFDPSYSKASGEDSDLSYRIVRAGYKIYFEKKALVSHKNILRFRKYLMVQFQHGYWRAKLYRKNISMIAKDRYGYWKDFLEVFLVIALIICLLINIQTKLLAVSSLMLFLFIIQLPLSIKITSEEKDIRYLVFPLVTFIRAFVRVLGGILGFIALVFAKK